jgi:hypothetical protein
LHFHLCPLTRPDVCQAAICSKVTWGFLSVNAKYALNPQEM